MTLKNRGRRISDSHPQCGNKGETKKIRKSAELFAVLEFLKNLRDAGIGTNNTENIVSDINDEVENKVGPSKSNNSCKRDVDMVRSIMNIRISKVAKEVRIAKNKMKNETNKLVKKTNKNLDDITKERMKVRDQILKKERERLDVKFEFLKRKYGKCCVRHSKSEEVNREAKEAKGDTARLE